MKRLLLVFLLLFGSTSQAAQNPVVVVSTSLGDFEMELFAKEAPLAVNNFLAYVRARFYEGVIFHRVIPNFIVQAGDVRAVGQPAKPTRAPIESEATNGLHNTRGMVGMARAVAINSADCHFYINLADNGYLDHSEKDYGYTVFAKVISGMDVIDKMAKVPVKGELPEKPIVINRIIIKVEPS